MKQYISSDPDILGGAPVIQGTRIPVEKILFLLKDGFNLAAITKLYPHLDIKTLKGVLDELDSLMKQLKTKQNASLS